MRVATAIAIFGAAALLPATAAGTHKPGHGGGPTPEGVPSLTAAPNPVVFSRRVTLSGRLTGSSRGGQTIILEEDPWPFEGDFVNTGTTTTASNGKYALLERPRVNTHYRSRRATSFSSVVGVKVRIRVSRRVSDSTPRKAQVIRFSGRACPQHDGARVGIQRRTRTGKWRTIRSTRLRDIVGSSCSRYSRRFRVYSDGTFRVKVRSPHADHANGYSRRKLIDVH